MKLSPERDTHLQTLRKETQNQDAGVHAFCPSSWTVRGKTLMSILNNHEELVELWKWSLTVVKDTEMKARIIEVKSMMKKFDFLFGCAIGKALLNQTEYLKKGQWSNATTFEKSYNKPIFDEGCNQILKS